MQQNSLGIPIAIVIAGAMIAGAVFYTNSGPGQIKMPGIAGGQEPAPSAEQPSGELPPVNADDHIRGNPNAPIVIVEYSDYDCPFCKNFHDTMNRVMDNYGTNGQVAWVYRHFPLQQLHPNAPGIAAASECVAELGGNDAFWTFSDLVFGERGTNEPTNLTRLEEFATASGVSASAYNECVSSGRYNEKVAQSVQEAIAAGGRGTPHSFVLVGDQQGVINGAQPYEVVAQVIDGLLGQIQGTTVELDASL